MKKRIGLVIICMLVCLTMAGCGSSKEKAVLDESKNVQLEQVSEGLIEVFSQMNDSKLNEFLNQSELQINLSLMQSEIPAEKEAFKTAAEAWNAAEKECGAYVSHEEYEVKQERNETIVSAKVKFEDREGEIRFLYNDSSYLKSMEVNPAYTKGEILKKAGLNTLLGMGTVFSVLIFIAFTISLLKYIPRMLEKLQKKFWSKKIKTEMVVSEEETDLVIEEQDDLELIAVIISAIAAESGMSEEDFVVRSVKRRKSNKWRTL